MNITGAGTTVNVKTAYEGIEGGTIVIGMDGSSSGPTVTVYTNDDGINAASKAVEYNYVDEDEEQYTKISKSSSDNTLTVYSGKVTVEIADDASHSVALSNADGTTTSITFNADGDGIDCNGSFYAYGGEIYAYGPTSGSNTAIDMDSKYVIGEGVTLFAIGSSGMLESPTTVNQACINYTNSISANVTVGIKDGSSTLYSYTTKKSAGNFLYTSPSLSDGTSYTVSNGSASTTVTASKTVSSR